MDPQTCYQQYIKQNGFAKDASQYMIVEHMQDLYYDLLRHNKHWLIKFLHNPFSKKKLKGLYIWGSVGRGKTHLMDMFFENLPIKQKKRYHFHLFMQKIHNELKKYSGKKKPLQIIAKKICNKIKLLCIDEFFVADIADAMILSRLLDKLFYFGCTIIITSNCDPDSLYKDGLHRSRFLPAIAAIKQNINILNLSGNEDFRYNYMHQSKIYLYIKDNPNIKAEMSQHFNKLIVNHKIKNKTNLIINDRKIRCIKHSADIAWFAFDELCNTPRSSADYIALAQEFHTIFIENIPLLTTEMESQSRRFIQLIDELYDRKVKLIASFAEDFSKIYTGTKLKFEFARTISRLQEMQSDKYLATPYTYTGH